MKKGKKGTFEMMGAKVDEALDNLYKTMDQAATDTKEFFRRRLGPTCAKPIKK
jgi:hypothetical protein